MENRRSHKTRSSELTNPEVGVGLGGNFCATCAQPCGRKKYCGLDCYRAVQRSGSDADRFWAKVNKTDGCWLWTANRAGGSNNRRSYGQFTVTVAPGQQKHYSAHVWAYEQAKGPIPDGLCVMHKCNTPLCVRAEHLELGTIAKNNADAARDGLFHTPRPKKHKVTTEQLSEIDALLASGVQQVRIAEQYGVTRAWVCQYAKGIRRKYDRPRLRKKAAA